jgi:predicted ATPase
MDQGRIINRISSLKLRNWRNFQRVDLSLEQRTFLIGPNAAGKSNLLDAIRFLRDIVSDGGGFQEAVRSRGGLRELRCFAARTKPNILIELALGGDDGEIFRYELEFGGKGDTTPNVVKERAHFRGVRVLNRPDEPDREDPKRLTQTALEQVNANSKFREVAEFLKEVRYLHVVPEVVRDKTRTSGRDDPFGGDLIESIARTSERKRNLRLKRMEDALRIAVPQLRDLKLEIDKRGVPHLLANYKHWRRSGAWQREDRFSDGTLRLLGLIWSLQEPGGTILLEEPEMSLNSGVVAQLAPLIARATLRSNRQSLISTHSAELLSNGVSPDEVFLLVPTKEGTEVKSTRSFKKLVALVEAGMPVGEAVMPETKSTQTDNLADLDLSNA